MAKLVHSLDQLVEGASRLKQVYKKDLQCGDVVIIVTRNSHYHLKVLEDNLYLVSGGWFDRKYMSPQKIAVNGCTWGGAVIKVDIVAACGLCIEFGNRVITSAIQSILVIKQGAMN